MRHEYVSDTTSRKHAWRCNFINATSAERHDCVKTNTSWLRQKCVNGVMSWRRHLNVSIVPSRCYAWLHDVLFLRYQYVRTTSKHFPSLMRQKERRTMLCMTVWRQKMRHNRVINASCLCHKSVGTLRRLCVLKTSYVLASCCYA